MRRVWCQRVILSLVACLPCFLSANEPIPASAIVLDELLREIGRCVAKDEAMYAKQVLGFVKEKDVYLVAKSCIQSLRLKIAEGENPLGLIDKTLSDACKVEVKETLVWVSQELESVASEADVSSRRSRLRSLFRLTSEKFRRADVTCKASL